MGEIGAGDFGKAADAGEGVAQVVGEAADHFAERGEAFALDAIVLHGLDHAGHVVDLGAELVELIGARVGLESDAMGEVAGGDASGGGAECGNGVEDPAPDQDDAEGDGEQHDDEGPSESPQEFGAHVAGKIHARAEHFLGDEILDSFDQVVGACNGVSGGVAGGERVIGFACVVGRLEGELLRDEIGLPERFALADSRQQVSIGRCTRTDLPLVGETRELDQGSHGGHVHRELDASPDKRGAGQFAVVGRGIRVGGSWFSARAAFARLAGAWELEQMSGLLDVLLGFAERDEHAGHAAEGVADL